MAWGLHWRVLHVATGPPAALGCQQQLGVMPGRPAGLQELGQGQLIMIDHDTTLQLSSFIATKFDVLLFTGIYQTYHKTAGTPHRLVNTCHLAGGGTGAVGMAAPIGQVQARGREDESDRVQGNRYRRSENGGLA